MILNEKTDKYYYVDSITIMEKLFIEFVHEWFHHSTWWFGCTKEDDAMLCKMYGSLLQVNTELLENSFILKGERLSENLVFLKAMIGWIVVFDQLARHASRHLGRENMIRDGLEIALRLVKRVLQGAGDNIWELSGHEFGFMMLPWRHTYKWSTVQDAICLMWKKMRYDQEKGRHEYVDQLRPFLIAGYQRCPQMSIGQGIERSMWQRYTNSDRVYTEWNTKKYVSILEFNPRSSKVILMEKGVSKEPIYTSIEESIKKHSIKRVIVSISGGVDSMVCMSMLTHMVLKKSTGLDVMCVYINYCNRDDIEEEFVVDWCGFWGIPLHVRRIREIQRTPCMEFEMREIYETYTRDVRYDTYRKVWGDGMPVVMLGHNQDDCVENIITNLCQKQKYDELRGMKEYTETSGIYFWRPLLDTPKKDIYQLARRLLIPYLRDSTPSWSCRGRIRDVIRPTLENFNPDVIESLFHLNNSMSQLMQMVDDSVDQVYKKTVVHNDDRGRVVYEVVLGDDFPKSFLTSDIFWRTYMKKVWNHIVGLKSVKNVCTRINTWHSSHSNKISLHLIVSKNHELILKREVGSNSIQVRLI